jgi:hypothetical protein
VSIFQPPFQAPIGRASPPPERLLVYQGTELGGIVSLAFDPEGRFVLVLGGDPGNRKLFRLLVEEESDPVGLYSDIVMQFVDHLWVFNHVSGSRIYVLWGQNEDVSGLRAVVLVDADNDGIFDSREDHTPQTWSGAGYDQSGAFTHDFVSYF